MEETICLACRLVLPEDPSEGMLIKHFTGGTHQKTCHDVTEWMKTYIKIYSGAANVARSPFVESGKTLSDAIEKELAKKRTEKELDKKRKRRTPELAGGKYVVSVELLQGSLDLHKSVCMVGPQLQIEQSDKAKSAAKKVFNILFEMKRMTSDISDDFLRTFSGYNLDPAFALTKVNALSAVAGTVQALSSKASDFNKMAVNAEIIEIAVKKSAIVNADILEVAANKNNLDWSANDSGTATGTEDMTNTTPAISN